VGSILLPTIWGALHERYAAQVLALIPSGEMMGQVLIACGVAAFTWDGGSLAGMSLLTEVILAAGLMTFTIFHGAVGVVQHTMLARVLSKNKLTSGFMAMVACTHLVNACCNLVVPRVMQRGGLEALTLVLLIPSVVMSVPAGCVLAWRTWNASKMVEQIPTYVDVQAVRPLLELPPKEKTPVDRSYALFLLSLWRALVVGLGHAFHSNLNKLLVTYGLTEEVAGMRVATGQMMGLLFLPVIGVSADLLSRRWMLVIITCFALMAAIGLLFGGSLPRQVLDVAVSVWSITQVAAPMLVLSLVPASSTRRDRTTGQQLTMLSLSYGIVESTGSLAQVLFMLVFGVLREHCGFLCVLRLLCAGVAVAAGASICLLWCLAPQRNSVKADFIDL
jgi:hypothetical protein